MPGLAAAGLLGIILPYKCWFFKSFENGAGKTALVMDEIRRAALSGEGGRVLLVPEQYSHEAERELARVAGPGLPLFAEVLSFTGLARKLEAELGSGGTRCLDPGGRLRCMALALESV